ncbi:unnamed protein product [Prorocentrum cordatum]|uniref:Uncharacterized protein n=1 Tax=Prorocentrum cordatum TaxID=2364126 RepID=A0ABN9XEH7_9DINO|nr:unnamed protein product [Polarella glacialis]
MSKVRADFSGLRWVPHGGASSAGPCGFLLLALGPPWRCLQRRSNEISADHRNVMLMLMLLLLAMVATGQPYELSVCERTSTSIGRTVVVDTPPYGHGARSERPLRPQGTRIPQWLSIVLNAHGLQSKAVVLTVDGTDTPLWEDDAHCADIAALIAALRRESVGVSVAVTKLGRQREIALYDASHGKHHGGQVGRDPRSGYETFASRYVEKVGAALRAKVSRIDDAAEELEQPSFLCAGKTIFDVPTWSGADEFKSWQQKRGTAEPPNFSYATARLRRLLQSTSEQAPPASASARL